jgi:hypothetical protein
MTTESGRLEQILIAFTAIYGAFAIFFVAATILVWTMLRLNKMISTLEESANNIRNRYRRQILMFAGIALFILAAVAAAMIVRIGRVQRSGDKRTVNWIHMVGQAPVWAVAGFCLTLYYFYDSWVMSAVQVGLQVLWPVILGVSALPSHYNQRTFLFVCAVVIQTGTLFVHGMSVRYDWRQWFKNLYRIVTGYLPLVTLIVCYVVTDVFWFIGYLNDTHPGVQLHTRWKTHLAFFLVGWTVGVVFVLQIVAWMRVDKKVAERSYEPIAEQIENRTEEEQV